MLVVEHKPETIAIADHVVDLGPPAGTAGGRVMFEGTVEDLRASDTSPVISRRPGLPGRRVADARAREVRGTATHNLRTSTSTSRSACWPWSRASPVRQELADHGSVAGGDGVVAVDQGGSGGRAGATPRRTPTSWSRSGRPSRRPTASSGPVQRKLRGACPTCNGAGVISSTWRDGVSEHHARMRGEAVQGRCWSALGGLGHRRGAALLEAPALDFFGTARPGPGRAKDPGPPRRRRAGYVRLGSR